MIYAPIYSPGTRCTPLDGCTKQVELSKDDARVRLTQQAQQVNLTSAIRTAFLTLLETFEERTLFERIASLVIYA